MGEGVRLLVAFGCLCLVLEACGPGRGRFESNLDTPPPCRSAQSLAGEYRCKGWALLNKADRDLSDANALRRAASLRFQIADALDQGGMSPEEAAALEAQIEDGPAIP